MRIVPLLVARRSLNCRAENVVSLVILNIQMHGHGGASFHDIKGIGSGPGDGRW